MKTLIKIIFCIVILLTASTCAAPKPQQTGFSEDSITLDTAINNAAGYFIPRLPQGAKVALVHFDTPAGSLSNYIFEELWTRFEDSQRFVMVDRRNLDRIETEIRRQYESGRVNDDEMVSITRQYGAEILVYGQMTAFGNEYRMTIYATDVERASSSQRAFVVRSDPRLTSLLNVSPEEAVEQAVSLMAHAVDRRTVITLGRISYADTQTVTSLSAWLKNNIITGVEKHRDKFQIATDSESASFVTATRGLTVEVPVMETSVQAVVMGTYSPLDNDAEVSLQLVSTTGNRAVLASARFVIPATELQRRRLSLLPDKDTSIISKNEFDIKQLAIDPYLGRNNRWDFTVMPDILDGIFFDGDTLSMQLYSARDCYFRIIHVNVNGVQQVIYPISPMDNNFIRAGQIRRIPDNTIYRLTSPYGEELILVAAYEQNFPLNQVSGTGLLTVESASRGLVVERDNRASMSPSATAMFSYTILPRW